MSRDKSLLTETEGKLVLELLDRIGVVRVIKGKEMDSEEFEVEDS